MYKVQLIGLVAVVVFAQAAFKLLFGKQLAFLKFKGRKLRNFMLG